MGFSNGSLSKALNSKKSIGSDRLEKIFSKYTDLNPSWLMTGEGKMIRGDSDRKSELNYDFKQKETRSVVMEEDVAYPYVVTVDQVGNENIVFVNSKARAGYLSGYGDPEFLSDLPAYRLPGFNNGTFRAFEVEGDSMYQYQTRSGLTPGSWVISERLEHAYHIRDARVYVIVSDQGIIVKRCINRLQTESEVLICQSDNKSGEYPDILLRPDQIWEVWEFKALISRHVPPPSDVYKAVLDLQAEVAIIKNQLKSP